MPGDIREGLRTVTEVLRRPTDQRIVDKFRQKGIVDYAVVPCSITDTIHHRWGELAKSGEIDLITTTNEGNLPAIAAGIYLGTGRTPLIHMQNSGLTNAADGIISLGKVYKFPMVALVTWRGSNEKDDSEPHQEIGNRTNELTHAIAGKTKEERRRESAARAAFRKRGEEVARMVVDNNIHGSRMGRGILHAIDAAVDEANEGKITVVRLSPDAFHKIIKPTLSPEATVFDADKRRRYQAHYAEVVAQKGTENSPIDPDTQITREQAMEAIVKLHPNAAILFCNGYTARAAQGTVDRVGNFYNTGNMGGMLAMGWALAHSNPEIEVVVVDGDQNAQMGSMKDNLAANYPDNLQWYILDNGIGASVGVADSVPLGNWHYELARVIPTIPEAPGTFPYPRVRNRGAYFDSEESQVMAAQVGALPAHMQRFRGWIEQQSERNRNNR